MPIVNCIQCNKHFFIKPNRLERGWGKYCSNNCKHLGNKTGTHLACCNCGAEIYRNKAEQNRSKSGKFFCNRSCQTIWRNSKVYFGAKHANWKDGQSSYRQILKRTKAPEKCLRCGINDVRILAVHHKDKNRQNNILTNLIWLCHNCHFLIHNHKSETKDYIVSNG